MLKVKIRDIKEGEQEIHITEMINNMDEFHNDFPEYKDEISVKGKLTKLHNRFIFNGIVECNGDFICDISTEEYEELISADLDTIFFMNDNLVNFKYLNARGDSDEIIISECDDFLDFTAEVRDVLILALPKRRISPKCVDKSFGECFPEYSAKNMPKEEDDRWSKLKNISFN